MEDREIVALFLERSQSALTETSEKYGEQLRRLAKSLLGDGRDSEECVNDALLGAWNSIPPNRPQALLPYLYRLVRNQCCKRYRFDSAQKRGGGGFDAAYEELEECVGPSQGPEQELEAKELAQLLNRFLAGLSKKDRRLFLGRYWFGEPYAALAPRLHITESAAAARLCRIREKLRKFLVERGALA